MHHKAKLLFSRSTNTRSPSYIAATALSSPAAGAFSSEEEEIFGTAKAQQQAVVFDPVGGAVASGDKIEDDQHAASSYKEAIFRQIEELQIAAGKRQQDLTNVVLDQTEASRRGKANHDSFVDDLSRVV